jgi:ribosomal-protein-alanine N-acetyltransferase
MNTGVRNNQWIIWAICLSNSHEIIGTISIWNFDIKKDQGELGYGLHPSYRGQGYMMEALNNVIKYAFTNIKLKTLQAYTSPENRSSLKLLEKLDFNYVNTVTDNYSKGKLMSIYEFNKMNWNDWS